MNEEKRILKGKKKEYKKNWRNSRKPGSRMYRRGICDIAFSLVGLIILLIIFWSSDFLFDKNIDFIIMAMSLFFLAFLFLGLVNVIVGYIYFRKCFNNYVKGLDDNGKPLSAWDVLIATLIMIFIAILLL